MGSWRVSRNAYLLGCMHAWCFPQSLTGWRIAPCRLSQVLPVLSPFTVVGSGEPDRYDAGHARESHDLRWNDPALWIDGSCLAFAPEGERNDHRPFREIIVPAPVRSRPTTPCSLFQSYRLAPAPGLMGRMMGNSTANTCREWDQKCLRRNPVGDVAKPGPVLGLWSSPPQKVGFWK